MLENGAWASLAAWLLFLLPCVVAQIVRCRFGFADVPSVCAPSIYAKIVYCKFFSLKTKNI